MASDSDEDVFCNNQKQVPAKRPLSESSLADASASCQKRAKSRVALDIQSRYHKPTLSDIQNLILRMFTTEYGENPKWIFVRGMSFVRNLRIVLIPCLDAQSVHANEGSAPVISSLLDGRGGLAMKSWAEIEAFPKHQAPAFAGCRLVASLLATKARRAVKPAKKTKSAPATAVKPLSLPMVNSYLATPQELSRSGYPSFERLPLGWVCTTDAELNPETGAATGVSASVDPGRAKLVAIDCEMVLVASGQALARVSVIGPGRELLYDTFVLPAEPVTDYVTEFSGITPEKLEGVKTTIADVQAKLLQLISADTILVGHSLENDLQALHLIHERVVDTALIFPHAQGWPHRNSLRGLSSHHLKRVLNRTAGHDSIEDARAALDLAVLKFDKGPDFGVPGGESVPLGRLLKSSGVSLVLEDRESSLPKVKNASSAWYFEGCDVVGASHSALPSAANRDGAVPPRQVRLFILRSFEEFSSAKGDSSVSGSCTNTATCLQRLDREVADIVKDSGPDDVTILLSGCGDFHLYQKSQKAEKEGDESSKEVSRQARKVFRDAFGVFVAGDDCIVAPAAPRRELISYDF